MNLYFFYHSNCFDGFGCFYYFKKYVDSFKTVIFNRIEVEYIPIGYGREEQEEKPSRIKDNSIVIFADYCPSIALLDGISEKNTTIVILDHHHTAAKDCALIPDFKKESQNLSSMVHIIEAHKNGTGQKISKIFDMERSGTAIVWDFIHLGQNMRNRPRLADYLMDRDLWKLVLPRSKEINAYIQSCGFSYHEYAVLDNLLESDIDSAAKYGNLVLKASDKTVVTITEGKVKKTEYAGFLVGLFNTTSHWSEVGNKVLEDNPDIQVSIGATFNFNHNTIMFSLRTRGDIDCSCIARAMGGGGHTAASGATVTMEQGLKIIKQIKGGSDELR